MLRIVSVLVCSFLITLNAKSQQNFWVHTNGPGTGQDVRSLASNSHGDLFAGTWTAGEVFVTTDNGDTWTKCGAIPNTNPILGLTIDQHDHLFASVYLRGVARSTDNGASWQMKNTGLTNFNIRGCLVDKYNKVWVATEGGLYRSTDDGENWTNMKSGSFSTVWLDSANAIVSETGDGYGNNILYRSLESGTSAWLSTQLSVNGLGFGGIAADGSYWAPNSQAAIFRSTDFGATWTDMHSPVSWSGYTADMMFTPAGDIFYARDGDAAGVLRSTDNGASWQVKNDGLTTTRVIPLFYSPTGYLFLGTNGAGVFRGAEPFWHQTGGPLATQDVRILTSNSQGTLFAGTWTAGEVYQTTNNGDTWTKCGAIPNTNPVLGLTVDRHDHLFASVFLRGIARSTDNGGTWEMKNNGLTSVTTRWSVMDKQGNVWVATEGGLFRTTDDGENWTKMHSAMCYNVWLDSTGAIITQEGDGTGFDNNGNSSNYVYQTTDGGVSWSTTHIIGKSFAGIHADGSYFSNTYSGSTIFRSTDRGTSWTDLHCPVSWDGYTAMMSFLPNGDIFFTKNGDGAGVIRSTDNGANWEVKNDGLTTLRVTYFYPHPNGYLFLATGYAGVFRSTQVYIPPVQSISVSLPDFVTAAGTAMEIPVSVTNLSGHGIYSYEITLNFNSPDSILSGNVTAVTAGTLSGQSGWSVQLNTTVPNQVKIGAYGALPLAGRGDLLRLRMTALSTVQAGQNSALTVTSILFNAGNPVPLTHNGSVTIHDRVCGDADENGSLQAYDAALTLREALGPMGAPPAPLTSMGRLNADVNMDGKVQAFDAALILRQVLGLPMPESTATCFGGGIAGTPADLSLSAKIKSAQYSAGQWLVQLQFGDVPAKMQVLSCSFELTGSAGTGDSTELSLPHLAEGYLATVNRLGDGHFRVGIINPNGVDVENIALTLTARNASSLNTITLSDLYLNDAPNASITMANIFTSVEPPKPTQPASYDLIGAYPNPFNPSTRVAFVIPSAAQVHLEIYNMLGVRIKSLLNGQLSAGQHEIFWDGTNDFGQSVATGQYYCLMRAGLFVKTVRLMLLK